MGHLAKEAFAEGQGMGWDFGVSKGRAVRGGRRNERTVAMCIAASTTNEKKTSQEGSSISKQ